MILSSSLLYSFGVKESFLWQRSGLLKYLRACDNNIFLPPTLITGSDMIVINYLYIFPYKLIHLPK
jgi:hypothetical protein